jgi:hypothetical protein
MSDEAMQEFIEAARDDARVFQLLVEAMLKESPRMRYDAAATLAVLRMGSSMLSVALEQAVHELASKDWFHGK